MRSMQWQLGILGTISAFAYRHRETKKNLCPHPSSSSHQKDQQVTPGTSRTIVLVRIQESTGQKCTFILCSSFMGLSPWKWSSVVLPSLLHSPSQLCRKFYTDWQQFLSKRLHPQVQGGERPVKNMGHLVIYGVRVECNRSSVYIPLHKPL